MTGKGGVVTIAAFAIIKTTEELINVHARPTLVDKELIKKAVATNPKALQMKIIDTVP
jgi:hypothetical protein